MYTIREILFSAGIKHENYAKWPLGGVYLTAGNQLIGTYSDLKRFQASDRNYHGWHAHHILESKDIANIGATRDVPPRSLQICV
ncbi:MAG: hypothetical protein ACJ8LM_16135, partial [Candidatus Udaeobacter sp.]